MADVHLTLQEYHALRDEKRPHKFRARPEVYDGIHFPSQRQKKRYIELKLLQQAGQISQLEIDNAKTTFRLMVNGFLVCTYRADATYYENGQLVVEDSKGFATPAYRLKRKLMQACHGITIRET